jgi:hypothetical protein
MYNIRITDFIIPCKLVSLNLPIHLLLDPDPNQVMLNFLVNYYTFKTFNNKEEIILVVDKNTNNVVRLYYSKIGWIDLIKSIKAKYTKHDSNELNELYYIIEYFPLYEETSKGLSVIVEMIKSNYIELVYV